MMYITLAQIVSTIPRVRPHGERPDHNHCELCNQGCGSRGQCPYCGREAGEHCWNRLWGCCKACGNVIDYYLKPSVSFGASPNSQMPPLSMPVDDWTSIFRR